MTSKWQRYKSVIAFFLVTAAFTLANWQISDNAQDDVRENSIEGCERANVTREELAGFLYDAAQAREDEGDDAVAQQYRDRAARVERYIVPNCENEF